jgi:hypothetical protein
MKRADALALLFRTYRRHPTPVRRGVLEYVREAEHQDGNGYWRQFRTPELLFEDVRLYLDILEEEAGFLDRMVRAARPLRKQRRKP